jgi:hypothetical protein
VERHRDGQAFAEGAAQSVPPEERVAVFDNAGTPPERVVGSSNGLRYTDDDHDGSVACLAEPDVFDVGPVKPVRIWSRIGRRPILGAGNSNGDIPMLRFAGGKGPASAPASRPARRPRARVRLPEGGGDRARARPRRAGPSSA